MGTSERAKLGRQHSSRDRQLDALDAAVGCRPACLDAALTGTMGLHRRSEVAGDELGPVIGAHGLELPAGQGELFGEAMNERLAVT